MCSKIAKRFLGQKFFGCELLLPPNSLGPEAFPLKMGLSSKVLACLESELSLNFALPVSTGIALLYSIAEDFIDSKQTFEFVAKLLAMLDGLDCL